MENEPIGWETFAWLPMSPVTAMAFMAVSFFVIWALTIHGRDITRA